MKKNLGFLIFAFPLLFFSQSIFGDRKDSIKTYTIQGNRLFTCKMASSNIVIGALLNCKQKEVLPGSEEYIQNFEKVKKFDEKYKPKKLNAKYSYHLPYKKGETYKVTQGYNGSFSHFNKNAIDFDMPEGTEVLAIREGVVTRVVQHNDRGCPTERCANFANFIWITHDDGSTAGYYHLKLNGAKVKQGDHVKKGDVIGYSGNTGFSSFPHLHLQCSIPLQSSILTLKTLFRTGDGKRVEYLYQGERYKRNYD